MLKNRVSELNVPFLVLENMCEYFIYFICGYMTQKYKNEILSHLNIQYLITICMIVIPLLFCIKAQGIFSTGLIQLKRCVVVIFVVSLFYNYRKYFEGNRFIPRFLNNIGTKTLDLYMVHYFFLWPQISFIAEILKHCHNLLLQIVIVGSYSLLVVMLSMFSIKLLRTSKLMSRYLFAA